MFPGSGRSLHWGYEVPSEATGTEDERLAVFRRVFTQIAARIGTFVEIGVSRARASVRVRHRRVTQLFLLRHAHAGNPAKWKGDDAQRPLSEKGTRQSERVGQFLSQVGFHPDAIVSSPKLRAAQTAEIVARQLRMDVRLEERLAGGADLHDFKAILADLGLDRPMLVGHDPDFWIWSRI